MSLAGNERRGEERRGEERRGEERRGEERRGEERRYTNLLHTYPHAIVFFLKLAHIVSSKLFSSTH